jgi:hypothetical protein
MVCGIDPFREIARRCPMGGFIAKAEESVKPAVEGPRAGPASKRLDDE